MTSNVAPGGIAGFVFDIEGEDRVESKASITDYHVEDNTTVQDNYALEPVRVILRGMVAELTWMPAASAPIQTSPPNPLPLNTPLVPPLTPGANEAQTQTTTNAANSVSATSGAAQNLYALYKGSQTSSSRQAAAFGYFHQLKIGRVVTITVETPWGIWTGMCVENIVAIQPQDTKSVTDFTITFKEFRTVSTISGTLGQLADRMINQFAEANPQPNGSIGTATLTDQQEAQIQNGFTFTPPSL